MHSYLVAPGPPGCHRRRAGTPVVGVDGDPSAVAFHCADLRVVIRLRIGMGIAGQDNQGLECSGEVPQARQRHQVDEQVVDRAREHSHLHVGVRNADLVAIDRVVEDVLRPVRWLSIPAVRVRAVPLPGVHDIARQIEGKGDRRADISRPQEMQWRSSHSSRASPAPASPPRLTCSSAPDHGTKGGRRKPAGEAVAAVQCKVAPRWSLLRRVMPENGRSFESGLMATSRPPPAA